MPEKTAKSRGVKIVLTADRTLMGHYPSLLDGMMATVQTTFVPSIIHRNILSPPVACDAGGVVAAPLGLRKIQSALLARGNSANEIAVVSPDNLEKFVGDNTAVIAISSGDPLGLGMTGTTMIDMLGGRLHTERAMSQLCRKIRKLKARFPNIHTVAGGPGAWQLANNSKKAHQLGIDTVFCGYGEDDIAELLTEAERPQTNADAANIVNATSTPPAGKYPITAPSLMGVIEISRGCAMGCDFCTLSRVPMTHADVDTIVHEAKINLRSSPAICLISEDLLRYGSTANQLKPDKIFEMLEAVRQLDSLKMIQPDHININSIAKFSDSQLLELRNMLRPASCRGQELMWVNLGGETADGNLMEAAGMRAKTLPAGPDNWQQLCYESICRMEQAGFLPMVSLIMGLPGETPESVETTLKFVRRLKGHRVTVFPIFLAPTDVQTPAFTRRHMTRLHWQLLSEGYEFNFKWIPKMFADNQRCAGASFFRRAFIQLAGKFQTLVWRGKFAINTPRGDK